LCGGARRAASGGNDERGEVESWGGERGRRSWDWMDLDGDVLGALVGGGRGKRKRGIPPEPTLVLGAHVAQMSEWWLDSVGERGP
jgi:hypothetical protein